MRDDNLEEVKREAIHGITEKTGIEKILASENIILGEERSKYLGVDKESVLFSYTLDELMQPETYDLLEKNMSNHQAKKILIRGKLYSKIIVKIIKIAQKNNLSYSVLKNPEFQGDVGLVITKKNY